MNDCTFRIILYKDGKRFGSKPITGFLNCRKRLDSLKNRYPESIAKDLLGNTVAVIQNGKVEVTYKAVIYRIMGC